MTSCCHKYLTGRSCREGLKRATNRRVLGVMRHTNERRRVWSRRDADEFDIRRCRLPDDVTEY